MWEGSFGTRVQMISPYGPVERRRVHGNLSGGIAERAMENMNTYDGTYTWPTWKGNRVSVNVGDDGGPTDHICGGFLDRVAGVQVDDTDWTAVLRRARRRRLDPAPEVLFPVHHHARVPREIRPGSNRGRRRA
jgi:hypothetical protein